MHLDHLLIQVLWAECTDLISSHVEVNGTSGVLAWEGQQRKTMFLGLTVNGIVIHAIHKSPRNLLWSGHGFESQQCCNCPAGPCCSTGGTGWHRNLSQPHIVTHSYRGKDTVSPTSACFQLSCQDFADLWNPGVFQLNRRCLRTKKDKAKQIQLKRAANHWAALTCTGSQFCQGLEHCDQIWAKQILFKMKKLPQILNPVLAFLSSIPRNFPLLYFCQNPDHFHNKLAISVPVQQWSFQWLLFLESTGQWTFLKTIQLKGSIALGKKKKIVITWMI